MSLPRRVEIVEVGPRDGLQNEPKVDVGARVTLIDLLTDAGLRRIEVGSFVSPKAVPQMAETAQVCAGLDMRAGRFSALVPNLRGLDDAMAAGVREIAVFASASESFSRWNINCSIADSLDRYAGIVARARANGLRSRGYVSCALGCPYEGNIESHSVAAVAVALAEFGCDEISLGDTIGVGTPLAARNLVEVVAREVPLPRLAVHFHDTYGQALANIFACLEVGVSVIDSSVAGLGGCPYAPGAAGNVATEDLLYMLDGLGVETGVDVGKVLRAGAYISSQIGRAPESRLGRIVASRSPKDLVLGVGRDRC